MIPTPFDWSRLITEMTDESFGISPDVIFQIVDNDQLHEVKAHKMILGIVSPTFKTMFFATDVGDKTANVIKIENTSAPAFRIMMDAVYNVKSIEASLKGKAVHQVFDVLILVEQYQIAELIEAVKKHLANYPITDDTVLELAEDANEYMRMFEAEAQQLLVNCAKFLEAKLKDLNAVKRYASRNLSGWANSQQRRVQGRTRGDVEQWFGKGWPTGRITKVEATEVNVENIKPGVSGLKFFGGAYQKCWMDKSDAPNFLFRCS